MYHKGTSESVLGWILADHRRSSFKMATRFPGNISDNIGGVREIFAEQLKRCRVDYFDYYIICSITCARWI